MLTLGEKVRKIRSKNAGPFWITIDVFCGDKKVYKDVCNKLRNAKISVGITAYKNSEYL